MKEPNPLRDDAEWARHLIRVQRTAFIILAVVFSIVVGVVCLVIFGQ
jgi:hypothetical protein